MWLKQADGGSQMIQRLATVVGYLEGISAICLFFIAMPMKYFYGLPEAVTVVGSIHGGSDHFGSVCWLHWNLDNWSR